MTPIVQNILWCVTGVVGVIAAVAIVKSIKRNPETPIPSTGIPIPPELPANHTNDGKEINSQKQTAKEAFLSNVDKFKAILPQLNGSLNIESWSEQIVDINNPQLTALWKRCIKNISLWKQMLSSWGLRQDTCKSFTYLEKYANMYDTIDHSKPLEGCRYRVVDGCWILTDDSSGSKQVVRKGIIEKS